MKKRLLARVLQWVPSDRPLLKLPAQDLIWERTEERAPSTQKVRDSIEAALHKIPYPYPPARVPIRSTYEFLEARTTLKTFLSDDFAKAIRDQDILHEVERFDNSLRVASVHQYSRSFHERLLATVLRHLREITSVLKTAGVNPSWIDEYVEGARRQLLKDVLVLHPLYPFALEKNTGAELNREKLSFLYQTVCSALGKKTSRTKQTAYHLTAILSTPPRLISEGILSPTPDAIRKLLSRRKRMR